MKENRAKVHAELCKSTGTLDESVVIITVVRDTVNCCESSWPKCTQRFGEHSGKYIFPDCSHALQTSFWPKLKNIWTSYGYSCIKHGNSLSRAVTFI